MQERMQSDHEFAKIVKALQSSVHIQEKPSRPIDITASWLRLKYKIMYKAEDALEKKQKSYGFLGMHHYVLRPNPILRYAVVLIFALTLSYFFTEGFHRVPWRNNFNGNYQVVNVGNRERLNISLPDGSQVTVDAGSEFKYFTSYQNERHVYLKGEACFYVASDPDRPFYVHAGTAIVRVVGTGFNVRAWEVNPAVAVTVVEGHVAVSRNDSLQEGTTMLSKGEQTIVPRIGPPTKPVQVDAEKYLKWMQNEIHFEHATVREVVAQLERWYDYKFEFQDPKAPEQEISIHIYSANVNEVIQVISLVTSTNAVRNGRQIKFMKKTSHL